MRVEHGRSDNYQRQSKQNMPAQTDDCYMVRLGLEAIVSDATIKGTTTALKIVFGTSMIILVDAIGHTTNGLGSYIDLVITKRYHISARCNTLLIRRRKQIVTAADP